MTTTTDVLSETPGAAPEPTGPVPVEVRRNTVLATVLAAAAAVVAVGYLVRVAGADAGATDWLLLLMTGGIALVNLRAVVDGRAPLWVADEHGVRLREGRDWRGLTWHEIEAVEVLPRRGLRDGSLDVLVPGEEPHRVPLALSTRLAGATGADVVETVAALADGRAEVVEISGYEYVEDLEDLESTPEAGNTGDTGDTGDTAPVTATESDDLPDDLPGEPAEPEELPDLPDLVASTAPSPLRRLLGAARAEVHADLRTTAAGPTGEATEGAGAEATRPLREGVIGGTVVGRALRRPGRVDLVVDDEPWTPAPTAADAPVDAPVEETVVRRTAVIGPQLTEARERLRLSVDQLADRTRIRPHVIEALEVDDFGPCGGDFYARGHLRTLARVLGVEAAPLLAEYDDRYADAPVSARTVLEAELGRGAIRGTRGGPNWSVLVAAVMAVVLAWSVARLALDSPQHLKDQLPRLTTSSQVTDAAKVPVTLTAAGGGAKVVVRDGANRIVFTGSLTFGQVRTIKDVSQPVRVQSSDGSLLVSIAGEDRGPLGRTGQPAQNTFVASS